MTEQTKVRCTRCGLDGAPRGHNYSGGPNGILQWCGCCDGSGFHSGQATCQSSVTENGDEDGQRPTG